MSSIFLFSSDKKKYKKYSSFVELCKHVNKNPTCNVNLTDSNKIVIRNFTTQPCFHLTGIQIDALKAARVSHESPDFTM